MDMVLTKYRLQDIADVEISGVDKKILDGETPIRLCNFTDVYYNWAITQEKAKSFLVASANTREINKFRLRKGMVALTKDSETRFDIGISTYIADDLEGVILGYHCALVTPLASSVNGKYLNAFISSSYIKQYCANSANGSGQRYSLPISVLKNMPILLPSIKEQQAIGNLLSLIDRKITLNRAINHNLEAMAKQLYDYWFVQFDFPDEKGRPYKSSGGKMVWNDELRRKIPFEWTSTTLGKVCEMYQPKTLGLSELDENGQYKVYGANGIVGRYHNYNHIDSEIAMACRGNSCGVINRTAPFSWITGNAMIIKMRNTSIHNEYIKQALQYANIAGAISGSGQPQLTRENLSGVRLCKPTDEILIKFTRLIARIVNLQLHNESKIESLTKLRNELLPLLMNGQVSVNYDLSHD